MEYIHLSMFSHISQEMALLFAAVHQAITTMGQCYFREFHSL